MVGRYNNTIHCGPQSDENSKDTRKAEGLDPLLKYYYYLFSFNLSPFPSSCGLKLADHYVKLDLFDQATHNDNNIVVSRSFCNYSYQELCPQNVHFNWFR